MKKKTLNTKQGFTIIEVVLVLAIAGLIFLMVFVAFPALQRNQRDTQRRQDYADLSAAVISAATNSNGKFPTDGDTLAGNIGKGGKGPQDETYTVTIVDNLHGTVTTKITDPGKIDIYTKATCGNDGNTPTSSSNGKQFVIYAFLEGGTYCLNGTI